MSKQRLDILLVEQSLCDSRQRAQRLIRAGEVMVDRAIVDKPGTLISTESTIEVKARSPFVSRGGEKLVRALQEFNINLSGRIALDGGISTGGFTDCLLQRGVEGVYGVDVGYGQVDWRIRTDSRVILQERTNLRYLTPEALYQGKERADLAVVDVSFISLTKVLPALWSLLSEPKETICLVKPQFEVGRSQVGKKGVVRDPKAHSEAIARVCAAACDLGWHYYGLTHSPITGPAGNIEYLLWLQSIPQLEENERILDRDRIDECTHQAKEQLSSPGKERSPSERT
ncbi:TlyA family RNA methyltransferase [Roseofilum casamattae]|uniref:TlyA family RNA methyltransferase n=1 Tax=Roseofilum casamattae BLCC-M143 TaxID=3022442 RepID=A0ABT7C219_9CYAN|nr:TlyA family RNA methyltransferase [Roseofilum casamattae]MDJ1185508.1 TlyA family RNA methyltransferase [Roseofilum casamattae BLCC-M143]